MEPQLTERDFWQQVIPEFGLADKLEAGFSDQCTSWPKVTKIFSNDPEKDTPTSLLDNKIRLEVRRALPDGENFMSEVFRLHATVADSDYRCFVKVLPQDPVTRKVAESMEFHQREFVMYSHLFLDLRSLLIEADLKSSEYLPVPQLYYANMGLNNSGIPTGKTVLAQEDLFLRGFRMIDKSQGCDLNHAKIALRSLAYFHALSITFLRKAKTKCESFGYLEIFRKEAPETSSMDWYQSAIQTSKDAAERLGYPTLAKKLALIETNIAHEIAREPEEEIRILACIIHGDYWSNNMLFQYDQQSGLPTAITIVDWQMCSIAHPAKDVAFFFMTSTAESLWHDHWNELLRFYFKHLRDLLCKLGLDLETAGYTEANFLKKCIVCIPKALPFAALLLCLAFKGDDISGSQELSNSADISKKEGLSETQELTATEPSEVCGKALQCKLLVPIASNKKGAWICY